MKIGVISDTHIPDRAEDIPKKILEDFAGVDMIIHVGDLVNLNVLKKLKSICANTKAVWGNMDPDEVRSQLPEKEVIKIGKYRIGIMHGHGAPANLIELLSSVFKHDNVDVIMFGHSHNSVNKKVGDILFFNPGSATDKVFAECNSYGIIEINDKIEARIIKI
ncbi:MAG: metallophosphoesterase [Candidatus Omnitrophota bacterium]